LLPAAKIWESARKKLNQNMASRSRNVLHAGAAHGTAIQLQQLLQQTDAARLINEKDAKGLTPLMLAAQALNVEKCLLLLQHPSCDVSVPDSKGRTALHYLCEVMPLQAGDLGPFTDALDALYERGGTSTVQDQKGYLPLHVACETGNYTAVSTILEHEPDIISKGTVSACLRAVLLQTARAHKEPRLATTAFCRQKQQQRACGVAVTTRRRSDGVSWRRFARARSGLWSVAEQTVYIRSGSEIASNDGHAGRRALPVCRYGTRIDLKLPFLAPLWLISLIATGALETLKKMANNGADASVSACVEPGLVWHLRATDARQQQAIRATSGQLGAYTDYLRALTVALGIASQVDVKSSPRVSVVRGALRMRWASRVRAVADKSGA
jgi:hypothetical protein